MTDACGPYNLGGSATLSILAGAIRRKKSKDTCRCFLLPMSKFVFARLARMMCLEDMRFILVRVESLYIPFVTATRVICTEKFIVGGINWRERVGTQVSDGKVEWMQSTSVAALLREV